MSAYGPDIQPIMIFLVIIASIIPLMLGAVWVLSLLPAPSVARSERKKAIRSLVLRHS
ncbi:MAG: hypothetical protein AB7K64_15120 [Variibacter sp.]